MKRKSKKAEKTLEELEDSVYFHGSDISDLKRDLKAAKFEADNLQKQMLYRSGTL